MKKMKKWQIWTAAGAAVLVIGTTSVMMFSHPNSPNQEVANETPMVQTVKDGSIASSVLLTGKVTADQEQYVYFDGTKGDLQSILVNVGDQVTAGQAIVQYSSTEAQTAYDAAVRTVNKADRQLNDLMTNGVSVDTTGDDEEDAKSASQAQRTVDSQASDLRDARADAVDNMNKAKALLDATIVKSSIDGTVVEVNKDVSKSTTGTNQILVHIVSNGHLQVKGELSEYNLANISEGQEVVLTSKVYPDKTWTGKISYVGNYPTDSGQTNNNTSGGTQGSGGAKYPFTVDITSDIGELKQGFSVNIEVKSATQHPLVPVTSVMADGDTSYVWTVEKGKAKKVKVTLGNADAENQEIVSGLKKDAQVIVNPNEKLEDGKEIGKYDKID